ncbi:MAG: Gfo/Idh/MocA family protein [Rubripirellula sp.]
MRTSPLNALSRRQFIAMSTAMTASAAGVSQGQVSANDRMSVAFIGVGGRGGANLRALQSTKQIDVVGLCDVDTRFLNAEAERFPSAATFQDFRKLYDELGDRLDAVVVSTPEHIHAYAAMPALQLGKHVYCEKPLAYNIDETRRLTEAAAAAGVVTQMGTQIHAGENFRRVTQLIQSGAIGAVTEAHVWVARAWGLQSEQDAKRNKDRVFVQNRPAKVMQPPAYLDWDLWVGPAPWRPFNEVYFPGPKWYRWWDFANGTMSDLGSHWNDFPFSALELDAPQTVQAFGLPPHPEIAPASMTAIYEYGPRKNRPAVKVNWYQGDHKPECWKAKEIPQWPSGMLFVGTRGSLLADYRKHVLLPEADFADFQMPDLEQPIPVGHHHEWVAACRGEGTTGSPFSYAGPLTEANHLGNIAYRVGKKITWDPVKMECVGCPEANPMIRREPRAGWSLG